MPDNKFIILVCHFNALFFHSIALICHFIALFYHSIALVCNLISLFCFNSSREEDAFDAVSRHCRNQPARETTTTTTTSETLRADWKSKEGFDRNDHFLCVRSEARRRCDRRPRATSARRTGGPWATARRLGRLMGGLWAPSERSSGSRFARAPAAPATVLHGR